MKAANPSHALASVLVDEFARCGVRHVCLAPGSRSAALALAAAAHPEVALHVGIDERSVAFLGLGIAKATGSPAAVVCTSGSAAANFFPAVVEAHHSTTPLLVLTSDRPPEMRATAANQTIDQIKLYGDAVRFFAEVGVPEDAPHSNRYWRSLACRAHAAATGSAPGPVHLNVAFREPLVPEGDGFAHEIGGRPGGRPWTEAVRSPGQPNDSVAGELVRSLSGKRVAVVAGDGRIENPFFSTPSRSSSRTRKERVHPAPLVALAENAGWPILAEPMSGLRVGANAITTYDAILRVRAFAGAHRPDVVVRIGKTGASKTLPGWLEGVEQVLIDPDGSFLDPERAIARLVRAEPAVLADRLCGRVAPAPDGWLEAWRRAERKARAAIDEVLDASDEPSEPRVARDLAAALADGSTLVIASSMPVRDLDHFMAPRAGLRVIGNRGASGIDGFVSTAIGIALASEARTVALAGDLSMLHDSNGLTLTSGDRPDLTFVVVNNDGGGIFSFLPQARHDNFELLFGTPHGLSFEHLAALHRCRYVRLERASELPDALRHDGVTIVEARTDRAANVELHNRISDAVERALL